MSIMHQRVKLAILSPFFYPEMISTGKYNYYLAKALLPYVERLDVVTSYPLYPDWVPKKNEAKIDGMSIHRAGLKIRYPKSAVLKRFVLELWFMSHVLRSVLPIKNNLDVVIGVFPPNIYMLMLSVFMPKSVRIIGIIHDLQGVMAKSTNSKFRRFIARIIMKFEKKAFNKCSLLICLSTSMRLEVIDAYGINPLKCVVQYPFANLELNVEKTTELAGMFQEGLIHIVYSGALGEKQKPHKLLKLLTGIANKRDDVRCHLISRGRFFDELNSSLDQAANPNVLLHDLVPESVLHELYERSSVQIIPQAESIGAGAFPSKLPNIIKAGVPVFAICDKDSELNNILSQYGVSKVVNTWKTSLLVEELNNYIDDISAIPHSVNMDKSSEFVKKYFSVDNLVEIILGRLNIIKANKI